jgi:drug/metabolite transporter (DMT)-like permease
MLAIVYLAIFTTLITFFLTQKSIMVLGPTKTMAYTFLNPALALLISCLLGDIQNAWIAIPGVGLTLISIVILQMEKVEGRNESR